MELQVGVKVLLKNNENKFLILKRSKKKYPDVEDAWDIVGGRIDSGVGLIKNLKREIKEETGLILQDKPKLIAAQDILHVPGRHIVRLTYVANITGTPILDDEHSDYGWFSLEELKDKENLDRFLKEIL